VRGSEATFDPAVVTVKDEPTERRPDAWEKIMDE
jgi:hypothetical protein